MSKANSTPELPKAVTESKDSDRVKHAKFVAMVARNRIEELDRLALQLVPAFVFKYDYSKLEDYDGLTEYAHNAADAMLRKRQKLLAEVTRKQAEEIEKAQALDAADKNKEDSQ